MQVIAADEPGPIRLELLASAHLSGQVVDAQGRGLAGVPVRARHYGLRNAALRLFAPPWADCTTRSTTDGRFELLGLPVGPHRVSATAADGSRAATGCTIVAGKAPELLRLRAVPFGSMLGTPRETRGRPLTGWATDWMGH